MAGGSPWKISALISAGYEFVLALFLLFRMILALVVLELMKYLPVSQTCSCSSHRHHHRNLLSSGRSAPFSSCREHNATPVKGTTHTPARFSKGIFPAPEEILTSKQAGDHTSLSRKAGLSERARSVSLSSVYKRKKRAPSLEDHHALFALDCKGRVDGEKCKCIVSEMDLYNDLIEVSSEYLKQKDRGHEEVILSLLKALQAERRNLRILYEELEEERIAAETAANETMGMILRLQEEKAALQMEADHYQRMAEEKSIYDEQAIQRLEEDLCRKENERLFLEEELSLLRRRSYGDTLDVLENVENTPCVPKVGKPFLLLAGIDEVSQQEEDEYANTPQNYTDQKCNLVVQEELLGSGEMQDQPMKRLKSVSVREQEILVDPNAAIRYLEDPENCQPVDDEDDANSILVQLSALEKQLLDLEEYERLGSFGKAHTQPQESLFTFKSLKRDGSRLSKAHAEDNCQGVSRCGDDAIRSESAFVNLLDEEKVVNVDVTNVSDGSYCDAKVLAAKEILEFHEGQRSRNELVQWEACEEEKHLDVPSFVPINSSNTIGASTFDETCKPDVECLQVSSRLRCEEGRWNSKSVTLEDINLRLQALENESTLLRHSSAPSSHDQMSMVLLRDVVQELQELLKVNRNGFATNQALAPMKNNTHVKGI